MSQLVGHFANVLVGHNWRDGDEIIIAKIMRQEGQKFIVRAKHGKEYNVVISDIKELVNVTARQKFSVGDEVNAEIDYHPLGGPVDDFCEILSVSCFANDVDYTVRVLKTGKTITLAQSHIKEHVYLKTPKYSLNQRIGVKHCDGHPYYYDEYIKNATIISVDPWYDQVNYIIRYDDGKSRHVPTTPSLRRRLSRLLLKRKGSTPSFFSLRSNDCFLNWRTSGHRCASRVFLFMFFSESL